MITIEKNILYNEDCRKTMEKLQDNAVDVVITSPPYNMGLRIAKGKYTFRHDTDGFSVKYNNVFQDKMTMDEYYDFSVSIIDELLRITKKYIFYNIQPITGNKVTLFKLIGRYAEQIKKILKQ